MLALARQLAGKPQLRKGVLFIAFAGEEIGLLGSTYYVNQPLLPLNRAVLMINMDMIGRIREGKVIVSGAGEHSATRTVLQKLDRISPLELKLDDPGVYGSSDHTAFQAKSIPVWFFFSGLHADYHKISDTWDKINARDAARLLNLISSAVIEVSDSTVPLQLAAPGKIFTHESNLGGR
ncbi:MAG: M28 family peptidase [Bryobacteraceae bacterium]